ncbi:nuclear transport factor 2 family protein [Antrihabitans cavernicola]|uniref:Nuclear transport factor 2 family protein n=1 Tax=Antrihabitans cavernicola TaxID=2495913 RepID=A0A5A7S7S0_9NOCA|nr:nuclear transport factor 2 family protein [Spelaeibacter cavernicola]KAA0021956.1 nuclear transport factor 2 family protein [Spelaeibacter cavernicola]
MSNDDHPARVAGRASQAAVRGKNKDAWLDLFAADGWVEDPVGPSGYDPEGKGHHGRDGIGKFWDMSIAHTESIDFRFHDSFACGNEAVFVGTIRTLIGGGQIDAEGVFKYRVDDDGKIVSLRAFWEIDRAMATATKA